MRISTFLIWVFNWSSVIATSLMYCKDSNPPINVICAIAFTTLSIGWTSYNGGLAIQEQKDINRARVERFKTIIGL